jgi:hypothetical protein
VYEFRIVNNCATGGTSASNVLQQVVKACPVFKLLESLNCGEIDFEFLELNSPDITSYTVNLYQLGNPTPLAAYTSVATIPGNSVIHTFSNLSGNTTYQINIVMHIQGSTLYTVNCPKQNVTTIPSDPCDPITDLTAELGPGANEMTLTWTPPSPLPLHYLFYFRRVGSTTYLQQEVANTETTVVLSGLTAGYDYEGYVVCVCTPCCDLPGCENLSVQVPFQTTSSNIKVVNSYSGGLKIYGVITTTNVPPITGNVALIGSGNPVLYGDTVNGSHVGFTDTFDFEVWGDSTLSGDGKINILKNGSLVECINIPASNYTFSIFTATSTLSTSYLATDQIMIVLENGGCGA